MAAHHYLHTGQHTCHADDEHEVACEGSGQDTSFATGQPWPIPRFDVCDGRRTKAICQIFGMGSGHFRLNQRAIWSSLF